MNTTTKYLRLLSYENALKVINFVSANDALDYAYITTGGVGLQVSDENWNTVEDFIKSLTNRYEITYEHPYKVEEKIVQSLRQQSIIK